jgi:hypothetical protein
LDFSQATVLEKRLFHTKGDYSRKRRLFHQGFSVFLPAANREGNNSDTRQVAAIDQRKKKVLERELTKGKRERISQVRHISIDRLKV